MWPFTKKKKLCGICRKNEAVDHILIFLAADDKGKPKEHKLSLCEECASLIDGNAKELPEQTNP